ncbi:MAG: glycine--tRNA ligase subunit beta [Sulfurimonas sp. RIFOXYD12_FULL_33_39]|uniref:glycine--tRNA ligase subunit beta n=1 Tax=unclassified Sulfurimonas TaxID=2623549 RepID=UPI0008B8B576|nr:MULTISPECIES: glycine--tRNA ligase subunit beta [unclassified Sulfurimonas]OHE09205.1 MAG: glycine--tRNA ligase subunit beta [Sulfurimonas sp. RIFOXYD12_FULL_33_39]OHE13012.1 MAG: glycine--tRNA ligase subunit beta [Sulfurimonas sp. RIFOXYD2_FULL_34_21]
MIKPLLIEIGVEELPAIPLLKELKNIEKKYADILEKNSLLCEFEFYYTPRRLVLWHREFKSFQDDSIEEFFGAPLEVAYKDGVATPAAEGFAKKCGVDIEKIGSAQKGGKDVLYYKQELKGKPSTELFGDIINSWINSLDFGKSMRWGSMSESFIRPIRWVNVLFGDELVDIELFGIKSKKETFVHRISNFDSVLISGAKEYFEVLKDGGVTLFPELRRENILTNFSSLENSNNIKIEIDEDLLDEVVAITEHPTPVLGSFDEEFLKLPPEVIITSMKEHQRYFPVFKDGKLINKFVVVSNALTDDFSKVIEGNERVLRPRLADALFFYNNDLKKGLSTKGLEKVIFMNGLGTVADKIEREKKIANTLFDMYAPKDSSKEILERAVSLAKADLTTEMVYEFTELQGLMGCYYAKALGESNEVATCIKEQYLPDGEESKLPSTLMSAIVAISLKLDTLLGMFSINQIPTGSRDPFALRRAVNGLIRITKEHNLEFDIVATLKLLAKEYAEFDMSKLEAFFLERVKQYFKVNPSIIEAVLASGERELLSMGKKIEALETMVNSEGFSESFSTFKRVANITKDIDMSIDMSVDSKLFEVKAEEALYTRYSEVSARRYNSYEEELDALLGLKPELDKFFEDVMVNADDEAIRNNRKSLVASIYKSILKIADIKEITI